MPPKKKKSPGIQHVYKPKKTPQQRLAELASKRGKNQKPLWDLERDGVTYTMLSRFMVCPERFRLSAVEGWSETGLQAALEFGSAFHLCLENPTSPPEKLTRQYQQSRVKSKALFPSQYKEFEMLMGMVEAVVRAYRKVYHKDDIATKKFVIHEEAFDVHYQVPVSGDLTGDPHKASISRPVRLRGRWDSVYRDGTGKLWLMENKTKSDIDVDGISRTLSQDLQTMLYVTALELHLKESVGGVLYNVIKRPQLRQGKSENLPQFIKRVEATAIEQQDVYFRRWPQTLSKGDLGKWQERTLNPLLRQIVMWWDSIKSNPFSPWGSPFHYQRPFGVYDSLASGRRGDFFELLTGGSTSGLVRRTEPFPELVD